ncbi:tetraacyldisaccharide 4'-kinase [Yeosuana marina]|uniref:tetraacyldisaccharide 4'-kinase n=1 Tax=Yeosuana marina TaxID=1565536 RepID=UPI0030EC5A2D
MPVKFYRKLLFPFAPVYFGVTWLRNKLYDAGVKKSTSFDFPVICVGNLSVGGTGKTPMIEYLIELLKDDYNIATLSRGYKRKTKGFQLANSEASVDSLGDESFQFYSKFKDKIQVAVDADRVHGIEILKSLEKENSPEIILLDDAFQHRKVKAGLNILLTTYSNMYTADCMLPAGDLREPISGAKRAHIIVITKCPVDLTEEKKNSVIKAINPYKYQTVFFSSIVYSDALKSFNGDINIEDLKEFTLVTGIANPQPLVTHLKKKNLKFEHLNFKDHHDFSKQDIEELNKKELIVTTEKDFVRLQKIDSLRGKSYYLPIKVCIDDSLKFNNLITDFIVTKL